MKNLFDRFDNDFDAIVSTINMKDICEWAFENTAECVCVYDGCEATWESPAEDAEYEVSGYDEYIECIVTDVAEDIAYYYGVESNNELKQFVAENLMDIDIDGYIFSETQFENEAIENYEEY